MTGPADLVILLVGNLYGKIQEHQPLPTIILALVTVADLYLTAGSDQRSFHLSPQLVHQFFQKYEPQSPGICAFLLLVIPAVVSGVFVQGASSTLSPLFRTYAIFYTSLILSTVSYRLSPFHPLARYPGPVLAKASKFWFVSINGSALEHSMLMLPMTKAYLGWQGKQHVHYRNLHKKYGDVVRVGTSGSTLGTQTCLNPDTALGPNEIMLSDVSVIAPLLGPGGWGKGSCT